MLKKITYFLMEKILMLKFNNQCKNPQKTQDKLLNKILIENAKTKFGQEHNFKHIRNLEEYKKNVPIHEYNDLFPYIDASLHGETNQLTKESPVLYTITSGTTGAKKYIPITPKSKKSKSLIMKIWTSRMIKDHPEVLKGKFFIFVSPEEEERTPTGVPCGSQSGSSYKKMPKIVKKMFAIPYEVYGIEDFDTKYYYLLRIAASQSISFIYACNPSTVLLISKLLGKFAKRIIEDIRNGDFSYGEKQSNELQKAISDYLLPDPERAEFLEQAALKNNGVLTPEFIWPDFKLVACWTGGTVGKYVKSFSRYFADDLVVRELGFFASEFFGSIPISDSGSEGVLSIQSNYYEFLPVLAEDEGKDVFLRSDQLEKGKQYYIYITTESGLYRYNINDIIEVTGFYKKTPLIKFVQKRKGFVSLTGEKLSEIQVINTVDDVLTQYEGEGEFISAIGVSDLETPYYIFLIEFKNDISESTGLGILKDIDSTLCKNNVEYESKRSSLRLSPPVLRVVESGEFDRFRKRRIEQGASDGTFKILRLTEDKSFAEEYIFRKEICYKKLKKY